MFTVRCSGGRLAAALVVACAIGGLLGACGDDDDDNSATPAPNEVLQLRGYDITAANFRTAVKAFSEGDPRLCSSIEGDTAEKALAKFDALGLNVAGDPIANATPVNETKQRNKNDELAAAQITLEECAKASTETPAGASPTGG